jgi:hypothetical protein
VTDVPFTFAAVAQSVAAHGWRPFPGLQTAKTPAMPGWNGLNELEWDTDSLNNTITDYQPAAAYCCCLAVQPEIVAIDVDIINLGHAEHAGRLADTVLGETPLVRVGLAPKAVRVYRAAGQVKSRKLHPLEIFSGSGQVVAFGWHAKAGRPYLWPRESPLTVNADDHTIPAVKQAQIDRFTAELFKVVPRRLLSTRQGRSGNTTVSERLRMLTIMHGSWKRAAAIVLSEACDGCYNETLWSVITSAAGRGIPEDLIWKLIEQHFRADPDVPEAKMISDITSMMERTRPIARQRAMTFTTEKNNGGQQ